MDGIGTSVFGGRAYSYCIQYNIGIGWMMEILLLNNDKKKNKKNFLRVARHVQFSYNSKYNPAKYIC